MAKQIKLIKAELLAIEGAVDRYRNDCRLFEIARDGMVSAIKNHPELPNFIHTIRSRVKTVDKLRGKLVRKALDAKLSGEKPSIDASNVFGQIHDLAGVRILHLYTDQIRAMDPMIREALSEGHVLVEGPVAHCWDTETSKYFSDLEFDVKPRESMYASVHYVVRANMKADVHCELQVRTLAEEIWGEVSHTIDYPNPTGSIACAEQLRVLARICSGTTRLVDSVFRSHEEFLARETPRSRSPAPDAATAPPSQRTPG